MARVAVFASGTGSNFVALARALKAAGRHRLEVMVCDRDRAPVLARAEDLGVPTMLVSYAGVERPSVEKKIVRHLERKQVDLVALAGFMRLLSPYFLDAFKGPVINLHPSLLPRHPGAHAIDESFAAGDPELGISVIRVDAGVDTGPVILQKSFPRGPSDTLETLEERIHVLEHEWFPKVIIGLLDEIDGRMKK
jgi:phosphoribosylglycinamide formyltransferase 1